MADDDRMSPEQRENRAFMWGAFTLAVASIIGMIAFFKWVVFA